MRYRHTCVLLSAVMLLTPAAVLKAQKPIGKAYLTKQTVAAACLRPKQLLTNPSNALLPIEVAKAAGEKYLGMDVANIEQAVFVIEPPLGTNILYALFLKADKPWDLSKLAPELTAHTTDGEVLGRKCLVSENPMAPCLMVLNETMLVAATQGMLEKLMGPERGQADTVLADLVTGHTDSDDLYVAVDMEGLRPLISIGMMQAAREAPPEMQKFLEIPTTLQSAELTVTLDGSLPTRLAYHAANETDADKIQQLLAELAIVGKQQMQTLMSEQTMSMRTSGDAVQVATADYLERMVDVYLEVAQPKREGNSFVAFDSEELAAQKMTAVAIIGVLVALLLPAVQAAREAARRASSMNNMKQINLALLNHEAAFNRFPAHAIYSKEGKPLLSWRVAILPFVEGNALYEKFRLDEPWDSQHNKQLISQMPEVFSSPNSALNPNEGKTNYLAAVGKDFVFNGTAKGTEIRQITDGTSNTVYIFEASDESAVPWTKPADWQYDPQQPLKGLVGLRPGIFLASFVDGSVQAISESVDLPTFKGMITKAGGELNGIGIPAVEAPEGF